MGPWDTTTTTQSTTSSSPPFLTLEPIPSLMRILLLTRLLELKLPRPLRTHKTPFLPPLRPISIKSLRISPSVCHTLNLPETITLEPSAPRLPLLSLITPPTSLPLLRPDQTKP